MDRPDFEPYDNVGRTAEQIAASYTGTATRDDLRRWSRRDSKEFLAQHPLPGTPPPALDPGPYIAALAAARTPAEVSAVTQHLLDAVFPTVREVSHLLVDIARWEGRHRSAAPDSPPKMLMTAASRCLDALALADQADIRALRDEYDPSPKPPQPGTESAPGVPRLHRPHRPRQHRTAPPRGLPREGRRTPAQPLAQSGEVPCTPPP
ncbi:hypothetical protein Smic_07810 [Streptomyces microflavus]|uniref:Uncharacterized protein n=1 Tax=Streptomyces microflavus TaxID=1919 RepID=A0A7J0CKD7_STRMI|nr:hypothetical protein Smic_07810 [Streptomyces microflavus]